MAQIPRPRTHSNPRTVQLFAALQLLAAIVRMNRQPFIADLQIHFFPAQPLAKCGVSAVQSPQTEAALRRKSPHDKLPASR